MRRSISEVAITMEYSFSYNGDKQTRPIYNL